MLFLLALAISCGECHKQIADQYRSTPMANSSGRVDPSQETGGAFYHQASNTKFQIVPKRSALELHWGADSAPLEFFIGSRRMGRSYALVEDGYLYQAPVGYYATRRAWDMAPGYQADHEPDFNRPVTPECLFCHASGARAAAGTLNRISNWTELHGIGCERCHGDGGRHVAQPRRDNIVNPARLPAPVRQAVCEQCHLAGQSRIPLPGKNPEEFRPGDALPDYLDVFVPREGSPAVRVNGHAEALARSRCSTSGTLWCGTCHNPHRATTSFREKCLGCHATDGCTSPSRDIGDCVRCHMPKARAYDGGHTVFTDHSIPRGPATGAALRLPIELKPYFARKLATAVAQRNLGLAYAGLGDFERAWPLLRAAAQAGVRDAAVLTQLASMLQADGHLEQALDLYGQSLKLEPFQTAALVKLGEILYRRGEKERAREVWKKALIMNPRQPRLREAMR